MADDLYLYEKPFHVVKNTRNELEYIHSHLTEDDRLDEKRIHAVLVKFLLDENLVEVSDESSVRNSSATDTGSWIWLINRMNFRSLVDFSQYTKLMQSLQVDQSYPITQIIDLHSRLGSLFDHKLLNTLCHRTLSSFSLIPYEVPRDNKETTWKQIHVETPFIWIILRLQVIISSEVKKA